MPDFELQTAEGVRLCEIFASSERLERTKIATKLYGGTYLMQTVGTPTRILDLQIRAWTREEQQAVNEAEAANTAVVAVMDEDTVGGFLLDAPSWSTVVNRAGIFEATVQLVVVES